MFKLCRRFLRQGPRRVSYPASATPPSHRPHRGGLPSAHGEDRHSLGNAQHIAEAHVLSSTSAAAGENGEEVPPHLQRRAAPRSPPLPRYEPTRPIVLEDVQDSVVLTPSQELSGQHFWAGTQVLRSNKHVRQTSNACVVGGASAIRRIWRTYKIRPTVVYVPNTEPEVPAWCVEDELPTVIVRCSPVAVKRQLLSAEYSDGFAAEFPLPTNCVTDATSLLITPSMNDDQKKVSPAAETDNRPLHRALSGSHSVRAMLVLVGLRIPSNVGALLRAAAEMGYDAAVLVNCVDATQEKVLRASDGTALSPTLRIYETDTSEQDCVSLLSSIAAQHHLFPFLAVPSQEVDPAFEVAKRFHVYNAAHDKARAEGAPAGATASSSVRAPTPPHLGAMVVLGSEAQGLRALHGTWSVPYQLVTLPLPNPMVDSFNVSVAGSVLLNLFRPAASSHFTRLVALSGETVADLLSARGSNEEEEEEEEEVEEESNEFSGETGEDFPEGTEKR